MLPERVRAGMRRSNCAILQRTNPRHGVNSSGLDLQVCHGSNGLKVIIKLIKPGGRFFYMGLPLSGVFVGTECLLLCGVSDDRCIGLSLFDGCFMEAWLGCWWFCLCHCCCVLGNAWPLSLSPWRRPSKPGNTQESKQRLGDQPNPVGGFSGVRGFSV